MARALGMSSILVNRFSGVLSAYGLSAADVVVEKQEACAAEYGDGMEEPPEVLSFFLVFAPCMTECDNKIVVFGSNAFRNAI